MDIYTVLIVVSLLTVIALAFLFIERMNTRYRFIQENEEELKNMLIKITSQAEFFGAESGKVVSAKVDSIRNDITQALRKIDEKTNGLPAAESGSNIIEAAEAARQEISTALNRINEKIDAIKLSSTEAANAGKTVSEKLEIMRQSMPNAMSDAARQETSEALNRINEKIDAIKASSAEAANAGKYVFDKLEIIRQSISNVMYDSARLDSSTTLNRLNEKIDAIKASSTEAANVGKSVSEKLEIIKLSMPDTARQETSEALNLINKKIDAIKASSTEAANAGKTVTEKLEVMRQSMSYAMSDSTRLETSEALNRINEKIDAIRTSSAEAANAGKTVSDKLEMMRLSMPDDTRIESSEALSRINEEIEIIKASSAEAAYAGKTVSEKLEIMNQSMTEAISDVARQEISDALNHINQRIDAITTSSAEAAYAGKTVSEKLENMRRSMMDAVSDVELRQSTALIADKTDIARRVEDTLREIQDLARNMKEDSSQRALLDISTDEIMLSLINSIRTDETQARESLERAQKRLRQLSENLELANQHLNDLDRRIKLIKRDRRQKQLTYSDISNLNDLDMKL